ncbi:MAG: serine hydrolase [Bacteroidales bacterium]
MINILFFIISLLQMGPEEYWAARLEKQFRDIEQQVDGNLGVYVRDLSTGQTFSYNAHREWYLSSTVKVPLAIALLQKVEQGEMSLSDTLILRASDYVDGAGDLIHHKPGTPFTVAALIGKMLRNSDSSATDMLMRLIGVDAFNDQIRQHMVGEGFSPFTTLLQVRYEAYKEVHENALNLTNMDFIHLRKIYSRQARMLRLVQKMGISEDEMKAKTIEEAFDRYYAGKLNSGTLEAMGLLLERLYHRELLSEEHTVFILDAMENITTGDRRIQAGLPQGTRFAQKTGTQIDRACNVGIIFSGEGQPIVVAACVEDYGQLRKAEEALEAVGRSLAGTFLQKAPSSASRQQ